MQRTRRTHSKNSPAAEIYGEFHAKVLSRRAKPKSSEQLKSRAAGMGLPEQRQEKTLEVSRLDDQLCEFSANIKPFKANANGDSILPSANKSANLPKPVK